MKEIEEAARLAQEARKNIANVIHGQEAAVDLLLIALATAGHALIEGVPGVGKTTLAKTLAGTAGLEYRRIQLTPDLMPADITGHMFYNQAKGTFEIRHGPAYTNILLADEINRAPPRTQSALLEVMEERQITIEGTAVKVPDPFIVLATKNPIDIEGVYPLPEAQLDRFMMMIHMDYPPHAVERQMLLGKLGERVGSPVTEGLVDALRKGVKLIHVDSDIVDYVLAITRMTREMPDVIELGAGPRGSEHLLAAARAAALIEGRGYVVPDDIQRLASAVLAHRIILTPDAEVRETTKEDVIAHVIAQIPVPLEKAEAHA